MTFKDAIYELYREDKLSQTEIGRLFKVNPSNINRIKQGRRWKHIK